MKNYAEAKARLGNRSTRKLDHNTYLRLENDGSIRVRLHNTDIVTFHPGGWVDITSGGWKTVTTKDRLNKFSPVMIRQHKGDWFVCWKGDTIGFKDDMRLFPETGMVTVGPRDDQSVFMGVKA